MGRTARELRERVQERLPPGETLLAFELVVPVAGATGAGGPSIGGAAGNVVGRIGAVKGSRDSIARSVPRVTKNSRLLVTNQQVALWSPRAGTQALSHGYGGWTTAWSTPRATVAHIERRRRLQLLARFRLHFTDGSSAAFMTPFRASIQRLSDAIG